MQTAEKSSKNARRVSPALPQGISYEEIRSALIGRGTNLIRWARANDYPVGSVYHAARNTRRGIATTRIRNRLLAYVRN
jgi:hypothetical protein